MRGSSYDLVLEFFGEFDKVGNIASYPDHQPAVLLRMLLRFGEDLLVLTVDLDMVSPPAEKVIDKVDLAINDGVKVKVL